MTVSLALLSCLKWSNPLGRDSCGMEQGLGWTQAVRSGVALPHGAAARRGAVEWSIFGGDVSVPCVRSACAENMRHGNGAGSLGRRRPGETPPDSRKKGDGDSVEAGGDSWAGAFIRARGRATGHAVGVTPL